MPTPRGMLGVHAQNVMARVNRLVKPDPDLSTGFRYGLLFLAAGLLATAGSLWVIPL